MVKKIFSLRIATELMKKGYQIIDYKPNLNNPRLKVFIFKVEGNFKKDLNKLINK